ncbi:MAG: TIGR03790 family protein [Deltaproteobacteria bacterium]|nr:TIGR03790 family protein [Deltaproteobacteria bacterium]
MGNARILSGALLLALVGGAVAPAAAHALSPEEVLVVANRNVRESLDLAAHYVKRRAIPEENLLKISVTGAETCSRKTYEDQIAEPVRRYLSAERGKGIRAAVLLYGVPLRVAAPEPTLQEQLAAAALDGERQELAKLKGPETPDDEKKRIDERLAAIRSETDSLLKRDQEASVDSELTLVRVPRYPLKGWVPNPLFLASPAQPFSVRKEDVLQVSRLDGLSGAVVRRVIDDSVAAEREGVHGKAYLDARWKDPGETSRLSGYARYDKSLHEAAGALTKRGIAVVLDENAALFPAGGELPVALYCGWYSLGQYVPAFAWQKGSVGYHIASTECSTLRKRESTVWCKRMLEEGVAATLGPVGEPYVQAFPPPHVFFQLLTDGRLTLSEAYFLSLPHLSWKMVLVGDPLYRPFFKK